MQPEPAEVPGVIQNANQVDVAPTVAKILRFEMSGVDGKAIVQVDETTGRIKKKANSRRQNKSAGF